MTNRVRYSESHSAKSALLTVSQSRTDSAPATIFGVPNRVTVPKSSPGAHADRLTTRGLGVTYTVS
jgi:hypothetical protein